MKTRSLSTIALALAILGITTGCDRALVLKTPLETDEKVSTGDTVVVDGAPAGHVTKIVGEADLRLAVISINEQPDVRQKMREGVVRVREDGRLSLRTGAADAQSSPLVNGAVVPLVSKPGLAIRQFTSERMLPGLMVGLPVVAVALLLFRRIARGWMLLLTLMLSSWIAWVALPWTSGAVSKVYSLLPPAPATGATNPAQKTGLAQFLSRLIESPPDPQAVAYAAVFVLAFIILSVALRSAINRLENRTCS